MGFVNVPADQEEVGEPLGALLPLVAQRDGGVIAVIVPEGNCDLISIYLSIYIKYLSSGNIVKGYTTLYLGLAIYREVTFVNVTLVDEDTE